MVGYALVACGYHMKHQKSSLRMGWMGWNYQTMGLVCNIFLHIHPIHK